MPEPQNEPRNRENRPPGGRGEGRPGGDRDNRDRDRDRDRGGRDAGRGGRPEGPPEIDIEKLIADSLYLDNQAHVVVSRMRDMDSGTKSQLRRLYNAVRRAVQTVCARHGARCDFRTMQSFRPGRPTPTHRYVAAR